MILLFSSVLEAEIDFFCWKRLDKKQRERLIKYRFRITELLELLTIYAKLKRRWRFFIQRHVLNECHCDIYHWMNDCHYHGKSDDISSIGPNDLVCHWTKVLFNNMHNVTNFNWWSICSTILYQSSFFLLSRDSVIKLRRGSIDGCRKKTNTYTTLYMAGHPFYDRHLIFLCHLLNHSSRLGDWLALDIVASNPANQHLMCIWSTRCSHNV